MTSQPVAKLCTAALVLGMIGAAHALADAKATPSAADKTFVQHAAADGMAEVQMGQMALGKTSNASLKDFAQHVVDDHTKANDQLKAIAASKQMTLPTGPDADAQKESKKLDALKGPAFDKAWTKAIVDNHKKAVKLFTTEAKDSKDDDLRKFAQATLPTLQSHLTMATQLAAVPDARDKSMDQVMKSMTQSTDPTTVTPAVATTPVAIPAATSAAKPTTPASTPTATKSH
ncbi:DUF4142 domain-containing protein [Rhodanobacter sp. L36]|uniref:DUF4142 domain-containing protein n=1 Tax=Rhodanobacter sp. L36 TaxID=1747221 RepID=UPI00131B79CD|nr:DUF4142 domain-containing protein [Rhodanobacter sp. L36]